ncbi:MAG: R3H domain-containing nucleic acid-binding protein [bacterium]
MNQTEIKKIIEEMLMSGGFVFDSVEIVEKNHIGPVFVIKTKDSGVLIGPQGETLRTLTFILKRVVAQKLKLEKDPIFSVDINDYRDATLRQLEHKARILADRAVSFKTTVELEPMSSYERMYVHSLFTDNPYIKTESVGEGKDRHITLKFVEGVDSTF